MKKKSPDLPCHLSFHSLLKGIGLKSRVLMSLCPLTPKPCRCTDHQHEDILTYIFYFQELGPSNLLSLTVYSLITQSIKPDSHQFSYLAYSDNPAWLEM